MCEAGALGDLPAQVDGEAAPERTGVGVPEHGGFVVVRVGVERGAEFGVVLGRGWVPQRQGRPVGGAVVDGAEAGGGEGGEDAGVGGDVFGGAFAAAESGGDQVVGVAAVGLGAGGAAGGAAVVAADEEVSGGQVGESRWWRMRRSRRCAVWTVGAVAVEADRGGAGDGGALQVDQVGSRRCGGSGLGCGRSRRTRPPSARQGEGGRVQARHGGGVSHVHFTSRRGGARGRGRCAGAVAGTGQWPVMVRREPSRLRRPMVMAAEAKPSQEGQTRAGAGWCWVMMGVLPVRWSGRGWAVRAAETWRLRPPGGPVSVALAR